MPSDPNYEADVRWTTHGVPHIRATDWGGLGFGQGWAIARDHLPAIADQIVKVRSERSLFHGSGDEDAHVASDFGYRILGFTDRAAALRDAQPTEVRDLVAGYAAGCNAWLAEARDDTEGDGTRERLPSWCESAEWIRPIDELDLYAYLGDLACMASGRNLAGLIGRAEAPGPDGPVAPSPMSALSGDASGAGASNGWAFGRDATPSGHGLVMANPHFPWSGEARFWECHLTIPGELDVYGVALLGSPGVQIGFNEHVAWTHTFSRGNRFALYRLDLSPHSPTSYRFGDEHREMTSTEHSVEVRNPDGSTRTVTRTLWSTHHGPMVNLPLLGWGTEMAFCYRDANHDNTAMLAQFLAMDRAGSLDEFQRAFADHQGMPWANTLAADRAGRTWYIDASATPALTDTAQMRFLERLGTDPIAALLDENRVPLLDGSEPDDDWIDLAGARVPGVLPHDRMPQVEATDVVLNANDSYWIPNPTVRLEGFSPMHGREDVPLSLRTRQNLRVAGRLAADRAATVESVLGAVFDNASLSAELLADQVAARCRKAGAVEVGGTPVDLISAADVLDAWDGRYDLDSVGAALWREVMASFPLVAWKDAGPLFAVPFSADDPLATPNGLAPAPDEGADPVVAAVVRALVALRDAGVAPDVPLGDVQWALRGDHRVPVHGGGEGEGMLNVLVPKGPLVMSAIEPAPVPLTPVAGSTEATGLGHGGYRCTYGTSFLMAVELTDDGPVGQALLAYGQSGDPESEHHVDGTEAYAAKATRPLLFRDTDIDAATQSRRTLRP